MQPMAKRPRSSPFHRDPYIIHLTLQLVNGGFQLYFGAEKAMFFKWKGKMDISFKEPCFTRKFGFVFAVEARSPAGVSREQVNGDLHPGGDHHQHVQPIPARACDKKKKPRLADKQAVGKCLPHPICFVLFFVYHIYICGGGCAHPRKSRPASDFLLVSLPIKARVASPRETADTQTGALTRPPALQKCVTTPLPMIRTSISRVKRTA